MGVSDKYMVWLVKGLAVIGGAALGGIALGLLLRLAGKWLSPRNVPRSAVRVVQILGAVISGWLVWILVTTPGSGGLLGGGNGSLLGGPGSDSATRRNPSTENKIASTEPVPAGKKEVLQVVMLGGLRVVEGRFYRLEGDAQPRNLNDLKLAIKDWQKKTGVKTLEILIFKDSVVDDLAPVKDLQAWAERNGFNVKTSKPPGNAP